MSVYPSGGSTDETPLHHSEDQSAATQFDARPQQQQQVDALELSTQVGQVGIRPQHQFDDRSRVDDGWQHECDHHHHHPSDTLANVSWGQHERYSGWPAPENNSTEPPAVRLPSFMYRDPLPPYVPDESSPEQYHGKVAPPERLGSYLQPRPLANPTTRGYRQFASEQDLNRTVPVYPQAIGQRALERTAPVYPQMVSNFAPKPPSPPPSYMAWSGVSMLCFLPLGIAALVYSSGVATEYAAGRYDKARSRSAGARSLNIASTTIGLLTLVAYGVYKGLTIAYALALGFS